MQKHANVLSQLCLLVVLDTWLGWVVILAGPCSTMMPGRIFFFLMIMQTISFNPLQFYFWNLCSQ